MKKKPLATYFFILLWVFWVMLIVWFGFKIGLIGFGGKTGTQSTVLFAVTSPARLLIRPSNLPEDTYQLKKPPDGWFL